MKNLKNFKKFAISQKTASIVSGGKDTPNEVNGAWGGSGTRYCCMDCQSLICGTNAKSVHIQCLDAQAPNRAIVVACS